MSLRQGKPETEAELKIKLSREDMEKVFKVLSGRGGVSKVSNKFHPRMYYDTPDLQLYKNNLSLRVQYKPGKKGRLGGYEQTIKVELKPDSPLEKGVMLRRECRNDIKNHRPDLATVVDSMARRAIKSFRGKKLVHIFTATIERRLFDMKLKNGKKRGLVEVSFDAGQLILPHDNRHRDFTEIEIEIKRGGREFIGIVKDEILKIAPSAKIQLLSKSDQGSRFYLKYKR